MSKSISDLAYDAAKQIVEQELEVVGLQVRDGLGRSCRRDEVETIVEGVVNQATAGLAANLRSVIRSTDKATKEKQARIDALVEES